MLRLKTSVMVSVICLVSFLIVLTTPANAKLIEVKKIPNGKKNSCDNCHQPGTESTDKLTPFGNDYMKNGKKWNSSIAGKDSDGDGMTNGQELGDPDGTWKKGDSDPSGKIFNPGSASSHK
jgi:hypothetical protein